MALDKVNYTENHMPLAKGELPPCSHRSTDSSPVCSGSGLYNGGKAELCTWPNCRFVKGRPIPLVKRDD